MTNKLTEEEITELQAKAKASFPGYPMLREGQKLMLALHDVNPNLYGEVTGKPYDPFYVDDRIEEFLNQIKQ